jgi:hypothetical protein
MEDLDFKNIGKGTLYTVPEDFFDQITEKTLAEAKRREAASRRIKRRYLFTALSAVGVAALIIIGVFTRLGSSGINKATLLDSLTNSSVFIGDSSLTSADSAEMNADNAGKPQKRSEIDKVISTLSDEEISLLADMSRNDLFLDVQ